MRGAKDALPQSEQPGTVYALGCTDCNKVYIGEIGRTTKVRSKEHEASTRYGYTEKRAVAFHALTEGHQINWQPNLIRRKISWSFIEITTHNSLLRTEIHHKIMTCRPPPGRPSSEMRLNKHKKSLHLYLTIHTLVHTSRHHAIQRTNDSARSGRIRCGIHTK